MKLYMRYGGIVTTSTCDFFDPYLLIIDEYEKTIELNDQMGMVEGMIHYDNEEEVIVLRRNHFGELSGEQTLVVENGKLIYKGE